VPSRVRLELPDRAQPGTADTAGGVRPAATTEEHAR
jgi:hypothetical protein